MRRDSAPGASWLLAAVLLAIATVSDADTLAGTCVGVQDGDTITVLVEERPVRVRLDGIDAPEKGDDYARKAQRFTAGLVHGKQITVRASGQDRYGRTIARVFVGDTDVSVALVRAGLAWHYTKASNDPELADAERVARAAGINIWSLPNPLPPWEARAVERKAAPPASVADVTYHGNRKSRVFHGPWCRYYDCKNCTRIFRSREEAIAAGFRPGGHCQP